MKLHITLLFLFSIFLFGCTKVVDADKLLDTEEKVSIQGYISPTDTLLTIQVSRALSSIGTPLSFNNQQENEKLFLIKDAVVTISDTNSNEAQLFYSDEQRAYITEATNLTILEDNEYFLEVIAQEQTFTASCKIPKKVERIEENIIFENTQNDGSFEVNIGFTDILGGRNFYVIGGFYQVTFQQDSFAQILFSENGGFLTDTFRDGAPLNGKTFGFFSRTEGSSLQITLQVAHTEEIVFQNLNASYLNSINDGNPFIEYSIAPNNIVGEGGIGVFGGYQLTEKVVEFQF
ncbi:MAG: DUF4249 domain-containing protein [Cellulophaga sp.]|nr:DUF4249 domain-containing protein [Cellulophaga sp.]